MNSEQGKYNCINAAKLLVKTKNMQWITLWKLILHSIKDNINFVNNQPFKAER